MSVEFFHGDDYKIPIYNSHVVALGMMTLVGKIIVHSILQEGPDLDDLQPLGVSLFGNGGCRWSNPENDN